MVRMSSTGATTGSRARSAVILVELAAFVVAVAGMRAFRDTLGPAFLALVLVVTVHPLQTLLRRLHAKALLIDADPAAQWLRPLLGDPAAATPARSPSQSPDAPRGHP
jgi:hypothetical protein